MHLRNEHVAHAGETPFRETKVFLLVDDAGKPTKLKGIGNRTRALTTADYATTFRIAAHFEILSARVKTKLDDVMAQLTAEAKDSLALT